MPELPEVESARRQLEKAAKGKVVVAVHTHPDHLVFDRNPPQKVASAVKGRKVLGAGRKGKHFWARLNGTPWVWFHFGMSGSLHVYHHLSERPSHWKMEWVLRDGTRLAWRDPRRFGRIRLLTDPENERSLSRLGYDPLQELPSAYDLHKLMGSRRKNLKALLLDQTFFAGLGNWIADEVLYQARLSPLRLTTELSLTEIKRLRHTILKVIRTAVTADADSDKFPSRWLFHYRWSAKHQQLPWGEKVQRETIAGRTTVWVPTRQH